MIDVLVVGGGPAGAAAAASACAEGMDVELVCAGPGGRPAPGESLPPGTDVVLHDTFGASPLNREQHRLSFGNRSAWGASRLDATDFMRNPFGEGWHLDRQSFDSSLVNRVRVQGVQVRADARVVRPAWRGDHWQVTVAGCREEAIRARAIVDASGRAARVARSQGARRRRLDQLVAAY